MDAIHAWFQATTTSFWVTYFAFGFVVWYLFNGLEAWLNGGRMGRGKWWVFSCVYEEMLWHLPGGKVRIQRHLQQLMCTVRIKNGIVTHEYNDLEYYENEARSMTRWRSHCYFWGVQMLGAFFFWPILLGSFLAVIVISNFLYDMVQLWKRVTGTTDKDVA